MKNDDPPSSPEIVFSARKLSKTYSLGDVPVHALRGVDLDLFAGEVVVLLGPSGSGKSTLLNILGGLDSATEGEVYYRDHNLVQATEDQLTEFRRDHVGFVFQFYNLIPSLNAEENVALAAELSQRPMPPLDALALVGLADRAKHFPAQLSGGEQQRVAIARAVSKQPDILLCDEPTGALDLVTGKLVLEAILRVNQDLGTLAVIITHNAAIARLADRVIQLGNGSIRSINTNARRGTLDEVEW